MEVGWIDCIVTTRRLSRTILVTNVGRWRGVACLYLCACRICLHMYIYMYTVYIKLFINMFVHVSSFFTSMAMRCDYSLVVLSSACFIYCARRYRNATWQDFEMKRGYTQVPVFPRMPTAMTGRAYQMPQASMSNTIQNGVDWGGFVPSSLPVSNYVELMLVNMFTLSCMRPDQAEQILKSAAARQGPYQD